MARLLLTKPGIYREDVIDGPGLELEASSNHLATLLPICMCILRRKTRALGNLKLVPSCVAYICASKGAEIIQVGKVLVQQYSHLSMTMQHACQWSESK